MMHPGMGPRKRRRRSRSGGVAWLIGVVLLAGCPTRFDPRAAPIEVRGGDPAAADALRDARVRFDRGETTAARDAFRALRAQRPADPNAPVAALWEARADLALGDPRAARAVVEPLSSGPEGDAVADSARFVLGVALVRGGDPSRGRELLRPFAARLVDGDDLLELHASLAEAARALGNAADAFAEYERYFEGARPVEQSFIRERAVALAAGLSDVDARRVLDTAPVALAMAVLGRRVADATADVGTAARLRDTSAAARRRFAFVDAAPAVAAAASSSRALGLIAPLSGKNRALGERALRGGLLSAGAFPPAGATLDLRVRDSGSRPEQAAQAVDELVRDGAVAIVGSPDRAEAAAIAERAEALGVPLLDLSSDESRHGAWTFKLPRANVARATALAEHALAAGARRFAVLRPDSAYGKKMADAFAAAIAGKGSIVCDAHFAEKATTFIAPGKQIEATHPDAVFVPATVTQFELVAAQLAALGVTRAGRDAHGRADKGPHAVLYATADGISGARFLANAGRYVQGAVLAPVFFADERAQAIVDRYRGAYGEEPSAADALAWDGVAAVRAALAADGYSPDARAALKARLTAPGEPGLTGPLGFGSDGERRGAPRLFLVDGEQIRALP